MAKFDEKKLLSALKGKKVLLLGHENADLDSICSELIFQEYLRKNKISSVVGVPQHINDRAQHFCISEKVSFQLNPNLNEFEAIVLFDLNSKEQLGALGKVIEGFIKDECIDVFVFDHHVPEKSSLVKGKNAFIDDSAVSTTQLLYNYFGKSFSKRMHFLNCLGVVEDTGHFLTGDVSSFKAFSDSLEKSKKTFAEVLAYAKHFVPSDERIAFLKAAQRADIKQVNGAIIVTSMVSFYQSAAASKLLSFGADVAIVSGQDKTGVTTLSGRVSTDFREARKFNLVKDLLIPLQEKFGGNCGGHSGAAQWKGKADPRKLLEYSIEILKNF